MKRIMNINKDSWHYKLVDHFDHEIVIDLIYGRNVTLCQYFWSVVGALVKAGVLVAGTIVLVFTAAILLYGLFGALMYLLIPLTGTIMSYKLYEVGFIMVVSLLVTITGTGVIAAATGHLKVVPDWMKSNKPETENSQQSLLWSWIKAKKDKVCPLVKLEEK